MCVRHGNKFCITKNKNVWWMSMPSRADVFDELFRADRWAVMQGRTEDSNSRTPEINLMARLGLRQAGLLDSVHASIIADLLSFNRFWQWEYPKHGHPWLRLLVAHTLMGADSFEYRTPGTLPTKAAPLACRGLAMSRLGSSCICSTGGSPLRPSRASRWDSPAWASPYTRRRRSGSRTGTTGSVRNAGSSMRSWRTPFLPGTAACGD